MRATNGSPDCEPAWRRWDYRSNSVQPAVGAGEGVRRIYTQSVQVILPTPDFSMPYNVICLSGTVWALYFGNVFNVLVRRYGQLRQGDQFVSDRPMARLIRFLRAKFARKKEQ